MDSISSDEELETRIVSEARSSSKQKKTDIELKHQKLLQDQQVKYVTDIFSKKSNTPVQISSIIVNNSQGIRPAVLQSYLDATIGQAVNVKQLCEQSDSLYYKMVSNGLVESLTQTLDSRGTFHIPISNLPSTMIPFGTYGKTLSIVDIVSTIDLHPIKKFSAKTGTNIGNGEGDGYLQFQWRNAFGGGEKFTFDATKGTKTHSSYLLEYTQPLTPWWIWGSALYKNSRQMGQAELLLRGIKISLKSAFYKNKDFNHEIYFENLWRSTKAMSTHSSDYLLFQCGDDLKSSLCHTLAWDTRDNAIFPCEGNYLRLSNELALGRYWKTALEVSKAKSWFNNNFLTMSTTTKCGYIQNFHSHTIPLHFSDKFHCGGSNDVRSFQLMGLGPKDLFDSMGGDAFVSYGVSAFSRLPIKRWEDSHFRLHAFFNGGRLINHNNVSLKNCISTLATQHSTSTGIGIIFAHPVARFELNFTVPLTAHSRDSVRKGFQYGIGLSFL
ncbi:LAFE_0E10528g1_1 [Lachancea fermentati]|uniref:LAFE_0E10528g1_1 n=1 Tax=Lachancea fermentati TaxID=4955 RepID=A0A1G4MDS2_LACFM|nr:LAFE_0E10528g1_1 [Lachancea fermentati]